MQVVQKENVSFKWLAGLSKCKYFLQAVKIEHDISGTVADITMKGLELVLCLFHHSLVIL
jgi:hypothetical protein